VKSVFTHDPEFQQFCPYVQKMLFVHNILKTNDLKTRNSVSGNSTSGCRRCSDTGGRGFLGAASLRSAATKKVIEMNL